MAGIFTVARQNRRYDGDPCHRLESVRFLAKAGQIRFTNRALKEDAPRVLPRTVLDHVGMIRAIVRTLSRDQWRFAEEDEKGWVDVYRVEKYNRTLWVKIKVEQRHARDSVIVISFHEWDDSTPI